MLAGLCANATGVFYWPRSSSITASPSRTRLLGWQRFRCVGNRRERVDPVISVAREDAGVAGHVRLHAVAVVLPDQTAAPLRPRCCRRHMWSLCAAGELDKPVTSRQYRRRCFRRVRVRMADLAFSRLRRAVTGQHHHVSKQHLYQYANEAAWREDHRRTANGAQHRLVLVSALQSPVSRTWKGYWQRLFASVKHSLGSSEISP